MRERKRHMTNGSPRKRNMYSTCSTFHAVILRLPTQLARYHSAMLDDDVECRRDVTSLIVADLAENDGDDPANREAGKGVYGDHFVVRR
jgi:hypothetical protein